jgi:uncharacterized membrane protein (UPF0136 family)
LAGIGGVAVTIYDRHNVQQAIDHGGAFTQALASVGWGLNLALAASASLVVAAVVRQLQWRPDTSEEAPVKPPVFPTAPPPLLPTAL